MKISYLVGLMSWVSIFALIWLSLFGFFSETRFSAVLGVFLGFVLMAFISSIAVAAEEKKKKEERDERKRNVSRPRITRTNSE